MTSRNTELAKLPERISHHCVAARSIPVLVVEDNRLLREGIVGILNQQTDLEVVVAEGGAAALRRLTTEPPPPPGVVVVDASLADHDPPTLVQRIRQAAPEARVIVMDLVPGLEDIVEFVKAGASGFIMKDATVDVLVETIRSVAAGREVLPPALTETLFSQIAQHASRRPTRKALGLVRMTPRERQIIGLIAEGLSNKEIAQRIHLSPHTVKSHVHNILEKLALHSRLQVAAYVHQTEQESESP